MGSTPYTLKLDWTQQRIRAVVATVEDHTPPLPKELVYAFSSAVSPSDLASQKFVLSWTPGDTRTFIYALTARATRLTEVGQEVVLTNQESMRSQLRLIQELWGAVADVAVFHSAAALAKYSRV